MKFNLLKVDQSILKSIDIDSLMEKLTNVPNGSFDFDLENTDELNKRMQNDSFCSVYKYQIYNALDEELLGAKVFVRYNESIMEVFNIISSKTEYSELSHSQYNSILDAFKEYVGQAFASYVLIEPTK